MKLKAHLQLMSRFRMCGAVIPLIYDFIISRHLPQIVIVLSLFVHRCANRHFREGEM